MNIPIMPCIRKQKKDYIYDSIYIKCKFIQIESRLVVAWGEGKDGQKGGMGHWETFGVD